MPNPAKLQPDSTLTRSPVVVRAFTALGETRLQLILALIITVGTGLWAWSLAATAFAAPPQPLIPPGNIGVAIESSGSASSAPISIEVVFSPTADPTGTDFTLSLTQIVSGNEVRRPPPTVIVFFCGQIARHPDFVNASFHPVTWRVPVASESNGPIVSNVFGSSSECVYTTLALKAYGPPGEFRQTLITGSSDALSSDISGTRVLYALPGVDSWFTPVPINGLHLAVMPPGSTVTVRLKEDASELENVFADPQLSDAGSLIWSGKVVTETPVLEYRLEADSLAAVSQLQLHLFIAGALVGVAGGAFVWAVQLLSQAGYGTIAKRDKRTKSAADREKASSTPDDEAPEPASLRPLKPDRVGLGWPD
jgi:hypothetical protein